MKSLILQYTPHDYQQAFLDNCLARVATSKPGDAHLYASPTGTGKSVMEIMALNALEDFILITPRLEIVAATLEKGGVDTAGWGDERLASVAAEHRIYTPIRLRNMLAKGAFPWRPRGVIVDEAHHDLAASYQDIRSYFGGVIRIGLTATPFRGTPRGTAAYLADWNDSITWVLTLPAAAARGFISVPEVELWPLVDDDLIEVVNGEFVVKQATDRTLSQIAEVVRRCEQYVTADCRVEPGIRSWDTPTMFAASTTDTVKELVERLNAAGLPAVGVTQDTPRPQRVQAFADVVNCRKALVQIDVVSEGVDLPVRRLIDMRVTMSPVKWQQQLGRITRPGGRSVYICTNRNLERHGYLWEGILPSSKIAEAQQMFGGPSKRAGVRAFGTETLGKFQAINLPLRDGTTGAMYALQVFDGFARTEYAVLLHPRFSEPLYATRKNVAGKDGYTYGRWKRIDGLPDLQGFASAPTKDLTDKQKAWWRKDAKRFGLDPDAKVNRKNFQAMPVLKDVGIPKEWR